MPVESKYPFHKVATIAMTILGTIAAIISIYVFFFQDKKVDLQYEIVANTNVLDINAEVNRLDIIYNGMNLKNNNEHLRIINLRIINRGNENILKEFFDDNDPLGFRISQGKIIEKPELIEASSQYLKDNLQIQMDSTGRVKMPRIILETKEYFVLKLLILHKSNILPEIIPTGKVAGIKQIFVLNSFEPKDQTPFLVQAFSGALLIQTSRAIAYFFVVMVIIVIVAASFDKFSDIKKKHRHQRIIDEFKSLNTYNYNKMDDAIFEHYLKNDLDQLKRMRVLLKDENMLNVQYRKLLEQIKKKEELGVIDSKDFLNNYRDSYYYERNTLYVINRMIEDGIIIKDKDKILINQPMKSTLDDFFIFLEGKKELQEPDFKSFIRTS